MTPYYEKDGIRIFHGDCRDVLPTLEAGSVDAVVTDPPYGQSNEEYDRGVDPAVWAECFRVAKPDAALLSFAGSPTYHRIASSIEAAGWKVRQMWAWVYRDGFITSAYPREGFDRLAPAMDPICFATKGKVVLPLAKEGSGRWYRDPKSRGEQSYSGRATSHGKHVDAGRWPRQVVSDGLHGWEYFSLPRASSVKAEKNEHPNQKPTALMGWLVGKLPGDTILDPFMGSGTTLVSSRGHGRRAIGIEANEAYCEIAARRLDQSVLPFPADVIPPPPPANLFPADERAAP